MKYISQLRTKAIDWRYVAIALLLVLTTGLTAWTVTRMGSNSNQQQSNTSSNAGQYGHTDSDINALLEEHGITPLSSDAASNNSKTAAELSYLIEEEKLAHDVYQAMYDKWGAKIFSNIQASESTHRNLVLTVMQSRNLPDPTKATFGQFTNAELQTLYDKLIAQGNQSRAEAYKVGIAIEEKDIADLKQTLAALDPKDTDIKDVLENLLHSSENHLRAFSRQANR